MRFTSIRRDKIMREHHVSFHFKPLSAKTRRIALQQVPRSLIMGQVNTRVRDSIETSYLEGFASGPKARAIPARASGPRHWANRKKQEGLKARHISVRGDEYNCRWDGLSALFSGCKQPFFCPYPNRWPSTIAGMELAFGPENTINGLAIRVVRIAIH